MTLDRFLKKYEGIINKISVIYSLPPNKVSDVIEHFMVRLKERFYDPRMPRIRIPFFGTFYPKIGDIKRSIIFSLRWYRKGNKTKEDTLKSIKMLWPIYRRLQREQDKENKVKTSPFWSSLDPETYPESYEEKFHKTLKKKGYVYRPVPKCYAKKKESE